MTFSFLTVYAKCSKTVTKHKLPQIADIVLVTASGYLLVKKAFDFSISGWLLDNALQEVAVDYYVIFSAILLIVAILIKIFSILCEIYPATSHKVVEPEEISECLQVMNNEIVAHIKKCDEAQKLRIQKLSEQHGFDVNLRLVTDALAEHIRRSIKSIKIKRKDLFISLYTHDESTSCLRYELHFDHKRDLVSSKAISLTDPQYENYECVKCINSPNTTTYLLNNANYAKGNSTRQKSIKHHMGCKLEMSDQLMGFLNIEFHNNQVFNDEEEMQDFMEEHVFPFKLLLEYQYLKRIFFGKFSNFNLYWEVPRK